MQADLPYVEVLLDADEVEECSFWDIVYPGSGLVLVLLVSSASSLRYNGSAMPSCAFTLSILCPSKSTYGRTSAGRLHVAAQQ